MTSADVEQLEERLLLAMPAGDVAALDGRHPDRLWPVTPAGFVVGKEANLHAHRSGSLCLAIIEPGGRHVEPPGGEVAPVNVATQVAGRFAGAKFGGLSRHTRVWCREGGRNRLVAGQACAAQGDPR